VSADQTRVDLRLSDDEVMERVKSGDVDPFATIVRRYEERAWRTARRYLGSDDAAADAVQDTFLRLLDCAPRYAPCGRFAHLFWRVLVNVCLSRKARAQAGKAEALPDTAAELPATEEVLVQAQRNAAVQAALRELPDTQRMAVTLRHFDGLSYAEIADCMGASEKAVERLLARAREKLAERLAELGG
jgi:RNA polymerase sigma-70 factor (ECF subfamily)